jgi:phage tail sheath protein FI
MALFTPSESPAIVVREIDLSGVVPNVQSTTGAMVGNFRWGPVEQATLIDNEGNLAANFGTPDDTTAVDFISAGYFLKYSNSLQIIRGVDALASNASISASPLVTQPLVKNDNHFDIQLSALDSDSVDMIAKYPGALGNSLKISSCLYSAADVAFEGDGNPGTEWAYMSSFDAAPGTSVFATAKGASNDEVHVVIVDEDGLISGTKGSVLETFPFLSIASNAKKEDGSTNYVVDVINARSRYIKLVNVLSLSSTAGVEAEDGVDFDASVVLATTSSFVNGVNSGALTTANYATGFDLFADKDTIQVDFLIAPGMSARVDQTTIVNYMVGLAQETRKDCIVVTSPARTDIVSSITPVTDAVTTANTFTSSSYLVVDNNYLKVYNKYADKYVHIPAASSIAGLMAATDLNAGPWFSPAGARRGNLLGVTALAYSPTKSERDTLYKAGINPIANLPGQGVLLFGDKTKLMRPSAFDRINVRRLFLTLERAIAIAARNSLFEFNDEFTRAEFVNIVEPFLREIKGRRGITDFKVVCDETNNTAAVIDRNEFIASIFIKPARSINYITLNFVAVRTGVDFEEIAGTV